MNYGYIYESVDKRNGMFYIGKREQKRFDSNYHGSGIWVKNIIKKHENNIFTTRVLDWADSKEELKRKEKAYIKAYRLIYGKDSLYNISDGGDGFSGPHSEEAKVNMRHPHKPISEKAKANMNKARIGTHLPKETCIKISKALVGKKRSEESKTKQSKTNTGKPSKSKGVFKQFCKHGHDKVIVGVSNDSRDCNECIRERNRKYREKQKIKKLKGVLC